MGANSSISWTDDTWNPWIGCAKVSPACDGCYAEALMGQDGRYKRAKWGGPGQGAGTRVRTVASTWAKPLKWNREQTALWDEYLATVGSCSAEDPRPDRPEPPPRFVFCASLADVFDNAVPAEWRRDLFDLIRATPNLTWLLLTKRPGNIVKLFDEACRLREDGTRQTSSLEDARLRWPRNAAIGCTVVDQEEADRDIPKLLAAKAALKPGFAFVSMEPLLGPVDFSRIPWRFNAMDVAAPSAPVKSVNALTGEVTSWDRAFPVLPGEDGPRLDWVITGGETDQGGHKARPVDPAWFRSLRDQCAAAGVPFHFKQWGEWQPVVSPSANALGRNFSGGFVQRLGKAHDPCTLDGVAHRARPKPNGEPS